ncbi:acyltransferase [Pseudaeromonas sharmana]|uniref:Acyltransferase n=1 Tax=Pseudaeromonas sharmana TaxID=328412 RepID=A0ABV8CL72_9GAMM
MLSFLPCPLIVILSITLTIFNLAFWSLLITVFSLVKLLLPLQAWRLACSRLNNRFMQGWLLGNAMVMRLANRMEWDIVDNSHLNPDGWHLIICNHLSWTDIVILGDLFRARLPAPKFFLKYELLYVPFVGLACWGLDMPFMRRYSREYLLKHPERRGKDVETTRAACAKFAHLPTTVINFVEGTRFTPQKARQSRSTFQYLMPPKAAGLSLALAGLGEQFEKIVNVTLDYPDCSGHPFRDLLCGRISRIRVRIDEIAITPDLRGDYVNDKQFKRQFQLWLNDVWQQKDAHLVQMKEQEAQPSAASNRANCASSSDNSNSE